MLNVDILQIIEIVLVFFALFGLAQIGLSLLNMITNAIDLVTVMIVAKAKSVNPPEQEYQSTNVIGFQVQSEEEENDDQEATKK